MTSLSPGIFGSLRKRGINIADASYVNISSPLEYWTNAKGGGHFCSNPNLEGGPPHVVVNGRVDLAWTTMETKFSNENYVLFDFYDKKVFLQTFGLETSCSTPSEVAIEGAFELNGKEGWIEVCHMKSNQFFPFYTAINITCDYVGLFSRFRVRQIGPNSVQTYRFHVLNFEFYGTLYNSHTNNVFIQSAFQFFFKCHIILFLKHY